MGELAQGNTTEPPQRKTLAELLKDARPVEVDLETVPTVYSKDAKIPQTIYGPSSAEIATSEDLSVAATIAFA
jgi:hypothetical protein